MKALLILFYFEWRSSRIQTSKFWGCARLARRNLCFCHDTIAGTDEIQSIQRNPTCRVLKVAERWTTTGQRGTPGCCRARAERVLFGRPIRSNVIIQSPLSLSSFYFSFFLFFCSVVTSVVGLLHIARRAKKGTTDGGI